MIILASIVERESLYSQTMPQVAGVYWNRLTNVSAETAGLLASDATVEYARDSDNPPAAGQYWLSLSQGGAATSVTSPWNTYTHVGLPPTPINSPSLAALRAAASPAATDCYYYLFRKADNVFVCAPTLAQLNQLLPSN